MAAMAGPGESPYTHYDKEICSRAQVWLREQGMKTKDRPWVLFVSFVAPHFPLTAPPEHFYRYWNQRLPLPKLYARELRPRHPYLEDYRASFCYDDHFDSEEDVRRAIAGYYGLVSYVDELIGKVLAALDETGLAASTRVLYTSDHGDNLGARGLWGKSTMYEEIAGVPLILAGPGVPVGRSIDTPASHVDCFPTIVEAAGVPFAQVKDSHPGISLFSLAEGAKPARTVLSEYHGMGSTTGAFAIRVGRYKYVHYAKYSPQLFDLESDPDEMDDLAPRAEFAAVLRECRDKLYALCDPEEVDRRAKRRQAELLAANGGREAVVGRGDLGFTPAPGFPADFQ
jgi:choline-sulfatase